MTWPGPRRARLQRAPPPPPGLEAPVPPPARCGLVALMRVAPGCGCCWWWWRSGKMSSSFSRCGGAHPRAPWCSVKKNMDFVLIMVCYRDTRPTATHCHCAPSRVVMVAAMWASRQASGCRVLGADVSWPWHVNCYLGHPAGHSHRGEAGQAAIVVVLGTWPPPAHPGHRKARPWRILSGLLPWERRGGGRHRQKAGIAPGGSFIACDSCLLQQGCGGALQSVDRDC